MTTNGDVAVHSGTVRATGAVGTGPVTKVTRHDRKRLNTGREYGRMCEECIHDLLGTQIGQSGREKAGRRRSVRNRRVA